MKIAMMMSLVSLFACATGSASSGMASGASPSCGALAAHNASRGVEIFAAPAGDSAVLATLPNDMSLCASDDTVGFGFRRVMLPNGSTGYVRESSLEN